MPLTDAERKAQASACTQSWYKKNREKARAYHRMHYRKNAEREKAQARAYSQSHKSVIKVRLRLGHLSRKYGLTPEQFRELVQKQGGRCPLCENLLRLGTDGLNSFHAPVDHDHKTGKTRGILCINCNLGLGLIERSGWLEKAMKYINSFQ